MALTPDFSVAGKVVLITGGTGGIGSAFAAGFLNKGADVIAADIAPPKTAILSLTKSLAIAWAADGIRVNAIAPGWIKTEISRAGRENPDFNAKVVARLPGGEWAEPEDLAGTAVFLASPAAKLITGVTIPVDGGYIAS